MAVVSHRPMSDERTELGAVVMCQYSRRVGGLEQRRSQQMFGNDDSVVRPVVAHRPTVQKRFQLLVLT